MGIFLAIMFCTIAERAVAQENFVPPLEGAITFAVPQLKDLAGQCADLPAV